MKVSEIVEKYLKDNGFDGLYAQGECACKTDNLMPCCGDCCGDCQPGYLQDNNSGEFEFIIGRGKQPADKTDAGQRQSKSVPADPNCENCNGTGWYGDAGPGRNRRNREVIQCECTYTKEGGK